METLKVKPIFINAHFDSKVGFYNDKMCYTEFSYMCDDWENKMIILISEDSSINKGDIVFRTDTQDIHVTNIVTDGFVGNVDIKLCKTVIATQNEISPQMIIRLIDEYNKTGKNDDIVVGIETLKEGKIIPRYTNGYITVIEEKEEKVNNIQNIKGWYYISNLDNQIHNAMDRQHIIIEHGDWTEIITDDGCQIDSCSLYKSLEDLLVAIK